jgi:hypothetical protein
MPCSFGPLPLFQKRLIPAGKAVQPVRPFAGKLGIKGRKRLIKLAIANFSHKKLAITQQKKLVNPQRY